MGTFGSFKREDLVLELFERYGEKMTDHLKGFFNLLVVTPASFLVANDHIGVSKFFSFHQGKEFLFSGRMRPTFQ